LTVAPEKGIPPWKHPFLQDIASGNYATTFMAEFFPLQQIFLRISANHHCNLFFSVLLFSFINIFRTRFLKEKGIY